jgi:hypothetical protein
MGVEEGGGEEREGKANGRMFPYKDLLPIASVSPPSATIKCCPLSSAVCLFSITGSRIEQNSLEVFGGHFYRPGAHLVSFRSTSLVGYSYYVPCQY